ncbi:hypothetical protein O181_086014 [Austropuccinia psidii MF-1]|uniref:Yeast cell wall synthesis Kre9/Knh1-like N-terminal domain-containing protein n=1 Tax=Austropuccinia psidii MF-1 TaxID=1389203 RepID=A0A9Q3FW68_9BASI|nr:hypothetical protein [Austropuccinia psidii MF-1]
MTVFSGLLKSPLVRGFTVTSPKDNEIWNFGRTKLVTWESVNTDPPVISLVLVNENASTYPSGFQKLIKRGVTKQSARYVIPPAVIKGLKPGPGYQINLVSLNGQSILAQSPAMTVSIKGKHKKISFAEVEAPVAADHAGTKTQE